jgi:DNA-binding response OmpR family regulator
MDNKKTVLVIDDSETTLILLEWFLVENKFKAQTAIDIKEALKILDIQKPDLILLDLRLPEISGFDFLEMIKADADKKDIPVFVISALDSKESIQKVKQLGAIDFISKPYKLDILLAKINKVLK